MILKLKLILNSFDSRNLNFVSTNLLQLIRGKNVSGPIFLPVKIKKFSVLRSPFKHKDTREEFEIRFYKIIFFLKFQNKITLIKFLITLFKFFSIKFATNVFFQFKLVP